MDTTPEFELVPINPIEGFVKLSAKLTTLVADIEKELQRVAKRLRFNFRTPKQEVILDYKLADEEEVHGVVGGEYVDIIQYTVPVIVKRRCWTIPGTEYLVTHRSELCRQDAGDDHPYVVHLPQYDESDNQLDALLESLVAMK